MKKLREYQEKVLNELIIQTEANKSTLVVMPTGSGKTVVFTEFTNLVIKKDYHVLMLTHRNNIRFQMCKHLEDYSIKSNSLDNLYKNSKKTKIKKVSTQEEIKLLLKEKVSVMMLDTLKNKDNIIEYFQGLKNLIIIFDECHHLKSRTWRTMFKKFGKKIKIGFTATPNFGLHSRFDYFDSEIQGPSIQKLVDDGFLAKPIIYNTKDMYSDKTFDLILNQYENMEQRNGDFVFTEDKIKFWSQEKILTPVIDFIKLNKLSEKQIIIFCINIKHAEYVSDMFNNLYGLSNKILHSKLNKKIIDETLNEFRSGVLNCIISVSMLDEGFDVSEAAVSIMLRPTLSTRFFLQSIGRVLRQKKGDNSAYILDVVNSSYIHGNPYYYSSYDTEEFMDLNIKTLIIVKLKTIYKLHNYFMLEKYNNPKFNMKKYVNFLKLFKKFEIVNSIEKYKNRLTVNRLTLEEDESSENANEGILKKKEVLFSIKRVSLDRAEFDKNFLSIKDYFPLIQNGVFLSIFLQILDKIEDAEAMELLLSKIELEQKGFRKRIDKSKVVTETTIDALVKIYKEKGYTDSKKVILNNFNNRRVVLYTDISRFIQKISIEYKANIKTAYFILKDKFFEEQNAGNTNLENLKEGLKILSYHSGTISHWQREFKEKQAEDAQAEELIELMKTKEGAFDGRK